jgi:hypothetical protein
MRTTVRVAPAMGWPRSQCSWVAVIVASLVIASSGANARAVVPSGNLIVNGAAEVGIGSSDAATSAPVPIPGWTSTTNFTEHTYDPAGSANFPDVNASAAIAGGSQFFAGGPANGAGNSVETATQSIDVSTDATQIDAGVVAATLSADLGGFASQEDQASVSAVFLGAAGQHVGVLTIGPVTAEDRSDTTRFLPRTGSITVPQGTRTIRVTMTATKFAGAYNDAYLDNISLSLATSSAGGQLPPPVIGKEVNVSLVSGKVFVRLPHGGGGGGGGSTGPGFVPLTEARQLPVGSRIDARAGTIHLVTAAGRAGTTQTGDFGGAVFGLAQSAKGPQKGLTVLSLLEGAFPGAPSYAECRARPTRDRARGTAAAVSSRVLQLLRATAKGRFRTSGRYSAATVRGTSWDTVDRCDGTLTRVRGGTVVVNDFVRRKTVIVHAGHSYLARAPGR